MSAPARPAAAASDPAATADPTLLQLARGGSRWAWAGIALLVLGVIVALFATTVLRPGKAKGGAAQVEVAGNPGFRMDYARGELRVVTATPQRVELTDADPEDQGSRLIVTPLQLPRYKGSPTGALPLASVQAQRLVSGRFDTVRFVEEGLVNIGPNPGYQLAYVATRDGETWFGRAAIVVPDRDGERHGLLMDGQEQRSSRIVGPRAVGRQGDLRRPMRSLVFVD